jgi:hypothetical protein
MSLACFPASAPAALVGSMPSSQRDLTPREASEDEAARLLVAARLDRPRTSNLEQLTQDPEYIGAGKGVAVTVACVAAVYLFLLAVLLYAP